MIITAVRLQNIKSYIDAELQFIRGINVIAGANGTGKSTIIEAVGLALFGAWPKKLMDGKAYAGLLRNGEKEGSIEVDVQARGRDFRVLCNIGSRRQGGREKLSYERRLFDAKGTEISSSAGRKEDFQEDMREHIIGASRIDDDELFRNIVGTEQGAFDDPFTQQEKERRTLFEKILGIEDFQHFEKQFWALVRAQRDEADTLGIRVEERAGVVEKQVEAEKLLGEFVEQLASVQNDAEAAAVEEKALQEKLEKLTAQREALAKQRHEVQLLKDRRKSQSSALKNAEALLQEAREAAEELESVRPGYDAFIAADRELSVLRASAKRRDVAQDTLNALQKKFDEGKIRLQSRREYAEAQLKETAEKLEKTEADCAPLEKEIETLLEEYRAIEKEKVRLEDRVAATAEARSFVDEMHGAQQTLENLGENMQKLHNSFTQLQEYQRNSDVKLNFFAELESTSEQFFGKYLETQGGEGARSPFAELRKRANQEEESARREASRATEALGTKREQGKSARSRLDDRKAEIEALQKSRTALEKEILSVARELKALEEDWNLQSGKLQESLLGFTTLDEDIAALEKQLESNREAHTRFLSLQNLASAVGERTKQCEAAQEAEKETDATLTAAEKELTKQEKAFTEKDYLETKAQWEVALALERKASGLLAEWKTRVSTQEEAVRVLGKDRKEYEKLLKSASRSSTEADFMQNVHNAVVRELARHVGASIVTALSAFAADLYQRIAPEQGMTLVWDAQSYAVELRGEAGRVRGRELSGGQLMGVSLAVKLALIKWYAQCRVGFLDEPTTHLDRETRRHLADVIQHLEQLTGDSDPWFDQLFIISHEESFAGAGHLVELIREPSGASQVV
ncbi:SMC family ATPase [bacterium]|nr:SMC family ATPase [bacterium]